MNMELAALPSLVTSANSFGDASGESRGDGGEAEGALAPRRLLAHAAGLTLDALALASGILSPCSRLLTPLVTDKNGLSTHQHSAVID
jgi:hypothetical protein